MAWQRPTLTQIEARISGDLVARVDGLDPPLRASLGGVIARGVAGAAHELHGFQVELAREFLPDTATAFLPRHAAIWGVARRPSAFAVGTASVAGTNGVVVPEGASLARADGVAYVVTAAATVAGGIAPLQLTAAEPGAAGNAPAGTALRFVSPVAGVAAQAIVTTDGVASGADAESDEALRARVLARIRMPPHGGSAADYVAWALAVPGVTRAWVYPAELGLGTVTVRFATDGGATPIPAAPKVAEVDAYIASLRPVTAEVFVVAPVAKPLDLTIRVVPETGITLQDARDAVQAELRDLLAREAAPGAIIRLSRIREAVSIAAGEGDNAVTVPAADFVCATGEMAVLGAITWVAP